MDLRERLLEKARKAASSKASPLNKKRLVNFAVGAPNNYKEINRIVTLPIIDPLTEEESEHWNRKNILVPAFDAGWRLWPIQCWAIETYRKYGGLFAPIGVGWGKSLISQCIAEAAYRDGIKKIALLVPPQVMHQLVIRDFPWARKHVPISYPIHVLGGKSLTQRRAMISSNRSGCYIIPYSLLSTKSASEILEKVRPELIICDEADSLGNRSAARTKRIMNYVADYEPQGVCMSGTITSKSIKDYYHLIKWCLGDNCPLPLVGHLADEWASKLDAGASGGNATGPIVPLLDWAQRNFPEEDVSENVAGFRTAYRLRLRTCPGVAATGDSDIGPSLIAHNLPVDNPETSPGWERLQSLISDVKELWQTPNGDEIEHAIHTWKWLYELSAGFYNQLTFPDPDQIMELGVSSDQVDSVKDLAKSHHKAQQQYFSCVRSWLEDKSRTGLDTPMLLGLDMSKNGSQNVGPELYEAWVHYHSRKEKLTELCLKSGMRGSPSQINQKVSASLRLAEVIRVCSYKIDHAVSWAKSLKGKGGIIWIWHQGMGSWAEEAIRQAGIDVIYCAAGDQHNRAILDPRNQNKVIVASISAHGVGKNLQAFNQQFFLQWPRSAKLAEQVLGRMHRNGQKSSEVWANTCNTSEFDQMNFAATLNDALYIHQSTGSRQKLIYCTYSPDLPKVFPNAVLRERGFQNKQLTPDQLKLLREKFGHESWVADVTPLS